MSEENEEEQNDKPVVHTAKVSTQDNVHLPKAVCNLLGIGEGDTIGFVVQDDGEIVVKKANVSVEV